jgi:hypothetical protein
MLGEPSDGGRRGVTGTSGQILEAIILYLDEEGVHHLHPPESPTLFLEWAGDLQPGEEVVDAVARLGLSPFLVHSTSWRTEGGHIVITFVVGIEPVLGQTPGLLDELVGRSELARGHALGPPVEVCPTQVVEHGLRHLAWLISDDESFHESLDPWAAALATYEPEPFRSFA